jgi:hypothetical protein
MAEAQMKEQAQTFGLFLLKNLENITAESKLSHEQQESGVV